MGRWREKPERPRTLGEIAAGGATRGLLVKCQGCDRSVSLPMRALIAAHGADAIARDIAARQTCGECRTRGFAWWVNRPADGVMEAFYYPPPLPARAPDRAK